MNTRFGVIAGCLIMLLSAAACTPGNEVSLSDHRYLFVPADIARFPIDQYWHKVTADGEPYMFLKADTELYGFTGLFGTILVGAGGTEVKYLCSVNILPTLEKAKILYQEMIPESSPRVFGQEETIDPAQYQADEAYLYRADDYFYLILRSLRVVYSVLLDGANVNDGQVRDGLRNKMAYLKQHMNEIQ